MLPRANDVNRLLLHDRYLRILAVEVLTLFPLLSVISYIFLHNLSLALSLLIPSIVALPAWLRWEARRKRRFMRIFQVVSVKQVVAPLMGIHEAYHALSIGVRLTVVDAAHGSMLVSYVDFEERRMGEKVILILDCRGRVLAAASMDRPLSLDMLTGLS
ncbi:MAG: hypothetical protein QW580_07630 [Nitrososphaerota archaeon]